MSGKLTKTADDARRHKPRFADVCAWRDGGDDDARVQHTGDATYQGELFLGTYDVSYQGQLYHRSATTVGFGQPGAAMRSLTVSAWIDAKTVKVSGKLTKTAQGSPTAPTAAT